MISVLLGVVTFAMIAVVAAAATSSLCVCVGSGSNGSNVIVRRGGKLQHCSAARRELGLMKLWQNARGKIVLVK